LKQVSDKLVGFVLLKKQIIKDNELYKEYEKEAHTSIAKLHAKVTRKNNQIADRKHRKDAKIREIDQLFNVQQ
jgi:hypothetical protein